MTSFQKILKRIFREPVKIIIEHRVKNRQQTYGIINHYEIEGYTNPADGDFWDVVIPGYSHKIRTNKFYTNDVIGIFILDSGNHKIFMKINYPGYNSQKSRRDISKYCKEYTRINNINGKMVYFKNI
jgi:hypothetical protein